MALGAEHDGAALPGPPRTDAAEALRAAAADWRASKPDLDHTAPGFWDDLDEALEACAARHGVDPDRLPEAAAESISSLAKPDEARADELDRLAERYAAARPELAASFRHSADLARHPAKGCRPGSRVLTDAGLHRVEADHSHTPLEAPEVARERRELVEQWVQWSERRERAQERGRRAVADVLAGRRRTVFAPASRRTPAPRPAARRPRRSSSSSRSSGSDPGDDGDEPPAAPVEPPDAAPRPLPAPTEPIAPAAPPRPLAGPSPRFSRPWRPSLDGHLAQRRAALDRQRFRAAAAAEHAHDRRPA